MSVKQADLADLLQSTLENLPKLEFEVMWDSIDYEFCRIYQNERMVVDNGTAISRRVMLDHSGNAKYRRAYDTDEPTVSDNLATITVPWCRISTDYSWDDFEILQNKNNPAKFLDLMEERRIDGMWSLADLIEERAWKTPESATDDLYPYGVPYYLSYYTDTSGTLNTSEGAFNGQAVRFQDATYSYSVAGINANTQAKWRNFCGLYTSINSAFLRIARTAFIKTGFKVPLFINDPAQKRNAAKRWYTNADNTVRLMDLADQKDDNHTGKDPMGNLIVNDGSLCYLNRLPVVPITELEDASYSPLYCVNFEKFIPVVYDGYWMIEREPITERGQHTTFTIFIDGAHNNLCLNRRKAGFVLHKAS